MLTFSNLTPDEIVEAPVLLEFLLARRLSNSSGSEKRDSTSTSTSSVVVWGREASSTATADKRGVVLEMGLLRAKGLGLGV